MRGEEWEAYLGGAMDRVQVARVRAHCRGCPECERQRAVRAMAMALSGVDPDPEPAGGWEECLSEETVRGYAAGRLSPEEREVVAGHLADCPACRAKLDCVCPLAVDVLEDTVGSPTEPWTRAFGDLGTKLLGVADSILPLRAYPDTVPAVAAALRQRPGDGNTKVIPLQPQIRRLVPWLGPGFSLRRRAGSDGLAANYAIQLDVDSPAPGPLPRLIALLSGDDGTCAAAALTVVDPEAFFDAQLPADWDRLTLRLFAETEVNE